MHPFVLSIVLYPSTLSLFRSSALVDMSGGLPWTFTISSRYREGRRIVSVARPTVNCARWAQSQPTKIGLSTTTSFERIIKSTHTSVHACYHTFITFTLIESYPFATRSHDTILCASFIRIVHVKSLLLHSHARVLGKLLKNIEIECL